MEPLILLLFPLFIFGGLFTYTVCKSRHEARWIRCERHERKTTEGPFRREHGTVPTHDVIVQQQAPRTIRRTALWSIYMGQMTVPGGLLGMLGMVVGGLGLVSIPGMILGVRIWRVGYALLRRDPGAEYEARKLCKFATGLNIIGVEVALVLIAIDWQMAPISLVLVLYAGVSFAHAIALRRCADLLAEDSRLRDLYDSGACQSAPRDMQRAA